MAISAKTKARLISQHEVAKIRHSERLRIVHLLEEGVCIEECNCDACSMRYVIAQEIREMPETLH